MLKKYFLFATLFIALFFVKQPNIVRAEIVEINGNTYNTENRQTDPSVTPASPYVKYWAVYNGVTWSIFDDKTLIMEGDGSGQNGPGYNTNLKSLYNITNAVKNGTATGNFNDSGPNISDIEYIYCDCTLYDTCQKLFKQWDFKHFTCGDNFSSANVTNMSSMFEQRYSYATCRLDDDGLDLSKFNTSNVTTMAHMFEFVGCSFSEKNANVILDLSSFDTSNVTDMSWMFYKSHAIKEVNLSSFDTSNVTNMECMFGGQKKYTAGGGCTGFKKIILGEHFDTSNVTNMKSMFSECCMLETIEAAIPFDTSSVTTLEDIFGGDDSSCDKLSQESIQALGVENWDVSNVRNFNHIFGTHWLNNGCNSITSLDLSGWDTSNAISMEGMFSNCSGLTSLTVPFNTTNVRNMKNMFLNCSSLPTLDVTSFDTSNVTNMQNMFAGCESLSTINVSTFDTSNVENMNGMFAYCDGITTLDVTGFDTSNVTSMGGMFRHCISLPNIDVTHFDTSSVEDMAGLFRDCSSFYPTINISNFNTSNVKRMGTESCDTDRYYWDNWRETNDYYHDYNNGGIFQGCSKLTSIDVSGFDTSNTENMGHMFRGCSSLPSINLTNFNTSNVKYMNHMFHTCKSLPSINLTNFNTSSVEDMRYMFYHCEGLTGLNINHFDTSNVKNMRAMFCGLKFSEINISNFDTSNVTNMSSMFNGSDFEILDLSNFDTSKVVGSGSDASTTGFGEMFDSCKKLKNVNLSSFTTSQAKSMNYMFYRCESLKSLDLSNFDLTGLERHSPDYTSHLDGNAAILFYCTPYILKLPKKVGELPLALHYFSPTYSGSGQKVYDYYAETGPDPRFENTKWTTTNLVNFSLDESPVKVLYRKIQIQYKKPLSEIPLGGEDVILQQEYICPCDEYPNATSPEPVENKVLTWKKSAAFPDCPYEAYTVGDTNEEFNINTNFATDFEETKDNYILTLRGAPVSGFKVHLDTISIGSHKNTDFNKVHKIKVDLKADNDYYWVSVIPRLSSGKMTLSDGRGHSYNMTVAMPKQKIYYSEVKNNPDVGNGYHQGELEITISGDILYPGNYTGALEFDINSGIGTD